MGERQRTLRLVTSSATDPPAPADPGDPERRPAETFAARLRALREHAGSPSYRELAKRTHFSASTLAEAVSGRRLPSAAVVRALAQAYGADPEEWAAMLARAAQPSQQAPNASATEVQRHTQARPEGADDRATAHWSSLRAWHSGPRTATWLSWIMRGARWLPRWAVQLVAAMVLFAVGTGFGLAVAGDADPSPAGTRGVVSDAGTATADPPRPAADGQDPVAAGCTADARVLGRADVIRNETQLGVVELKYSFLCQAGWARFLLAQVAPAMFATVSITAGDGTAMSLTMFVTDPGAAGAIYTDVLTTHGGCLSASASLEPAVAQHVSAATPCTVPTA